METLRLFAAIRPPSHIVDQLVDLKTNIDGARWSPREKIHLTLAFFGDVTMEAAELLDEKLANIRMPGFDVEIDGTGHFGKAEPYSLWAGVKLSEPLAHLSQACLSAARRSGLEPESRKYRPHITLAYLGPNISPARIIDFEQQTAHFRPQPFLADRFFLYSSLPRSGDSNLYREEASYPLLGR